MYNNSYDLNSHSLDYAQEVVSLQWRYAALKKSFWKFLWGGLAVPFSLLLGLWLNNKRKSFVKHMRNNHVTFNTASDYKKVRLHLDKVRLLYPFLKEVKTLDLKDLPWGYRYCGHQILKMTSTLVQYFTWLEKELDCLNQEQFKSHSKTFKFTSEKELWENRNKAYQYWM